MNRVIRAGRHDRNVVIHDILGARNPLRYAAHGECDQGAAGAVR